MAELTLDTGDITAALRKNLEGWSPSLEAETMGYVTSVGDGVARVAGLPNAMASEPCDASRLVLNHAPAGLFVVETARWTVVSKSVAVRNQRSESGS